MKKFITCFLITFFGVSSFSRAGNEIGFNAGELIEKATLSKALGSSSSGWFLPFHFTYSRNISADYQITSEFIYRFDNHGTFDGYKEYLALVGVGYWLSENILGSVKVGGGKASGPLSAGLHEGKNGGFVSGTYSCAEFAGQVAIEQRFNLGESLAMGLGGGLLVIIPTSCKNEIAFSIIGNLIHRYAPIFNWNLVYKF